MFFARSNFSAAPRLRVPFVFLWATIAVFAGETAAAMPSGIDDARLLADEPAPLLSAYHLFLNGHSPNTALTPYALNTPLFSDYAEKSRYVYLPPGTHAGYKATGPLDFPIGAVLVKTFAFPKDFRAPNENVRLIETRLLIHKQTGWVALAYVWNAAATDAVLKRAGARVLVSFVDATGEKHDIDYGVPNANQCKQCHSANGVIEPIGPKARNLNGDYPYGGGAENQLAHWARLGLLIGAPAPGSLARTPRWDDAAEPISARARAYLDVNCGFCHSPEGLASNSGLNLTFEETDPTALGIGKHPVAAGRGSGDLKLDIAPGHPEQSILLFRMQSVEPGVMMPQIGRTLAHREGIALIRDYIAKLAEK